ncbi:MAG: formate/nitrite transporter family protein [Pedobacter sp.]|nr:MAG: formate/nitrite transporter family protein [Pedobacter sp.]
MDYVSPKEVANNMLGLAIEKSSLKIKDLLIRGALSGALLGIAVTLAYLVTAQTKLSVIGALLFPVGFIIVVLLGSELATGSCCLLPLAWFEKKISFNTMLKNLFWVFLGNLVGSLLYAFLFWLSSSDLNGPIEQLLIKAAEKKTIGYKANGFSGVFTAFVKGLLCNWMVCMGVVMAMTSKSTLGKIFAGGIPIFIFFSLGFEHAVVKMFVIPAGMLFGAKVTFVEWWLYNQLIVTLGNLIGGLLFTGMAIYYTHTSVSKQK